MKKTVKRIDFRVKLAGKGVVNFDSVEQKFIINSQKSEKQPRHHLSYYDNNISYAKKNFYEKEDGTLGYKLKLSEAFLANALFREDCVAQHSNIIIMHEHLLYPFIASPMSLLRGYMLTNKHNVSLSKKSAFSFPGAEQTNDSISYIETFSRSGQKEMGEKPDNTFFKKETVGDIEYAGEGSINVGELQFVSCSQQYDRYSFNPDRFNFYSQCLSKRMPNFKSELGYFQLKTSCIAMPEYGFMFSNENVVFLVKEFLKRLYKFQVLKRGGDVRLSHLEIKFVTDVIEDIENREDGWKTLKSFKDIENLDFETEEFYTLQKDSDVKKLMDELEEAKRQTKEKNDKIQKDAADKKAGKKEKAK